MCAVGSDNVEAFRSVSLVATDLGGLDTIQARYTLTSARRSPPPQVGRAGYAGRIDGARRSRIEAALISGLGEFADYSAGKARLDVGVASCFRNLGWMEGADGQTTEALRGAFSVTVREVWSALHRITLDQRLTVLVLGRLGDALFAVSAKLWVHVEDGYEHGKYEFDDSEVKLRDRLARRLLGDESVGDLETLAESAGWPLSPNSVVLCAHLPKQVSDLESELSKAGAFLFVDEANALVLCEERSKEAVLECFASLIGDVTVTISPPALPSQIVDAVRLALRAQSLVEANAIPRTPILDCSRHKLALWLHSEPLLRDLTIEEMFAALAGLTARRRVVLAATMIAWLEQGRSARAAATQLGVHPQTVRYRLRQLHVLMARRPDHPELALQALMALKAILPLWAPSLGSDQRSRTR